MIKRIKEKASDFFDKHGLRSMTFSMHLIYGLLTFSYLGPQVYNFFTGSEVNWTRALMTLWVGQVWFFATTNMTLRNQLYESRKLVNEAGGLVASVNTINSALVERIRKMPPDVLHEAGIKIKKNDK